MSSPELTRIVDAIRARQRFVIASHARPDGDAIGSQLAAAFALRRLGKEVSLVNADPAPPPLLPFPGVSGIRIADRVDEAAGADTAAIIMECGDLARTGVAGLDRFFVINIDHHPGNAGYGQLNWFDATAAACGEMVFDLVRALGVPLTREIATHVYLAILTDTGSFRFSNITPRTFEICREALQAGADAEAIARQVYDSNTLGHLKLYAAVLGGMQIAPSGRIAVLYLDQEMARRAGAAYDDTEGIVNRPLSVTQIQAVVFFKQADDGQYRVSLRSKGDVDVRSIATALGGGGHRNAAGCTVAGPLGAQQKMLVDRIEDAIDGRAARR